MACVAVLPLSSSLTLGLSGQPSALTDDPYNVPKLIVLIALVSLSSVAWFVSLVLGWRQLRLGSVHVWLGAFAALVVVSTVFAREPLSSLFGASRLMTGAVTWLACAWMCFLIGQLADTGTRLIELTWAVIGGATVLAAIVILQAAGVDPLSTPVTPERLWTIRRGAATLGNPDYTGLYLIVPAVITISLYLSAKSRTSILAGVCGALINLAALLTLTRAAWLGVFDRSGRTRGDTPRCSP